MTLEPTYCHQTKTTVSNDDGSHHGADCQDAEDGDDCSQQSPGSCYRWYDHQWDERLTKTQDEDDEESQRGESKSGAVRMHVLAMVVMGMRMDRTVRVGVQM